MSVLAKISKPVRTDALLRQRLFTRLDRDHLHPVVWVSAPPGSGKTTLVSSYIDERKLPCVWYQVDEGDADIATFFYYMGVAVKKVSPGKRRPLPVLTPEYSMGIPVFTLRFFENLFSRLKSPSAVVFDNYQAVPDGSPFHEVVRTALENVPDGINVIVISRMDTPPAFASLRGKDMIDFVGWNELRLTPEEAIEIADRLGEKNIPADAVREIHRKVDGWVSGLVLMIKQLILSGHNPPALSDLDTSVIFDYFAGEIIRKTGEVTRLFLMKTAFLPIMTVRTAEALSEMEQAGGILEDLCRSNYFTVRRSFKNPVYEYHPLFRDFLKKLATGSLTGEELVQLKRKAAGLLEEEGQTDHAVALLAETDDFERLVPLVLQNAPVLMSQGRTSVLERWIKSIPGEMFASVPWLLYWYGVCRTPYEPDEALMHLEKAYSMFKEMKEPAGLFLSWSAVVDAIIVLYGDLSSYDYWIAEMDRLMKGHQKFPSEEIEAHVANSMFSALMFHQPGHPGISLWEEKLKRIMHTCTDVNLRLMAGVLLSQYYVFTGNLPGCGMILKSFRELRAWPEISPQFAILYNVIEYAYYDITGHLEKSMKALTAAYELACATGVHVWDFTIHGNMADLASFAGDYAAASEYIKKYISILGTKRFLDISQYHHQAARDALFRGDIPNAREHAGDALEMALRGGMVCYQAMARISLAEVLFEAGEFEKAERHLQEGRKLVKRMKSHILEYGYLLNAARFALDQGKEKEGLALLRSALSLGRKKGIVRYKSCGRSVMTRLCLKALEAGIEVEHVQDIIRKLKLVPERPPFETENWPWPVKVFTLGRFGLVREGKPVRLTKDIRHKPLEMLMALIALGGRYVGKEQLMDAIWPESDGDMASQSFKTTMHRLRKILGNEDAVLLRDGRVTLNETCCWVDSWAFERLTGQLDEANREGLKESALTPCEKALALYRGHFLGTDAGYSWAVSYRERLRSRFLKYAVMTGRLYESSGQWKKAIDSYQRALAVDDLVEEFYRRLMVCYQKTGRKADAVSVYDRCCKSLEHVFGVGPSENTNAVYRTLNSSRKENLP